MMIDYEIYNFCVRCRLKVPKKITRCTICNWLVRTAPIKKHEEKVVRY